MLTQGVAAVALAVVVLALGQAARGRDARRIARRIEVAGLAAVVLSLVQGAHGIRLADWVAPGGDGARVGRVFEFINRIDGVKMLLLAIVAVSGMALARQAGRLPRRADFARVVLAAALTPRRGRGYLLPNPALAWMALLALPLLLVWVAGMGVWLYRGLAVGRANHGQQQANRESGDRCLPQASTQNPGTVRIPGRSGRRRLTGRGQTALATGNAGSNASSAKSQVAGHQQNLFVLAAVLAGDLTTVRRSPAEGDPGQLRTGTSARGCSPHRWPVMAMSIRLHYRCA